MSNNLGDAKGARSAVDAFLAKKREGQALSDGTARRGRLIFALDATMSRQPRPPRASSLRRDERREAIELTGPPPHRAEVSR